MSYEYIGALRKFDFIPAAGMGAGTRSHELLILIFDRNLVQDARYVIHTITFFAVS